VKAPAGWHDSRVPGHVIGPHVHRVTGLGRDHTLRRERGPGGLTEHNRERTAKRPSKLGNGARQNRRTVPVLCLPNPSPAVRLEPEGGAMRRLLAGALALMGLSGTASATELKVGDVAPPFMLQGSDGKTHDLAKLKGKTVVLAWFPKAFTGG